MSKKMQWTQPQLIVLAKGTPEESVLTHCKRIGGYTGPVGSTQNGCNNVMATNCGNCHSRSGS